MKQRMHTLRKAAILIASLDERTAEALLTQMGPTQAQRVRQAIDELEEIDPREQSDVVEEFRRLGPLLPDKSPAGLELDAGLARKLERSQALPQVEEPSDRPPFRFLHEAEAQSLIPLLEREHPQTIDVVVSHLPASRAADVLSRLPSPLQGEVVRRLGDLDEADPEILREVERGLEKFISEQDRGRRRRAVGMETIAAILAAADNNTRHQILSGLAGQDQTTARRMGTQRLSESQAAARAKTAATPAAAKPPQGAAALVAQSLPVTSTPLCTFEDLMARKDAAIVATVRAAGIELSALALAGATPQLAERVASRLRRWEARTLRRALADPGPTRLRDVEQAQQELANLSVQFDDKGRRIKQLSVLA